MTELATLIRSRVDLVELAQIARSMVEHSARLPSPRGALAIGLTGTLGAGKTAFVQAVARAAGVAEKEVTSPTFTLLQTYQGRTPRGGLTIHHLDAYRVSDSDEFLHLGFDELLAEPETWTIVEWADRVAEVMPVDTLWVRLAIADPGGLRDIEFRGPVEWVAGCGKPAG